MYYIYSYIILLLSVVMKTMLPCAYRMHVFNARRPINCIEPTLLKKTKE